MRLLIPLILLAGRSPLFAQDWNTSTTRVLIDRAVANRSTLHADSTLQRYRSRAHGTVLFFARVGGNSTAELHLLRADRLDVEVYWQAPRRSKQVIRAWGQQASFPTNMRYHRDHLGIVTDDFGDAIRLGDGDEVRGVVHPLSVRGPGWYDYRLTDSVTLRGSGRSTTVHVVQVRPRDPSAPGVAGTLYLDGGSAALVRFRFGFTAASYLQANLERITVDLESALYDQRYWVPFRQDIEMRRRTAWLEFPLQTVIRTHWDIADYDFDPRFSNAVFAGALYGGLSQPRDPWTASDDSLVQELTTLEARSDPEAMIEELRQLVLDGFVVPQPPARLAFGGISELMRVNRVQGIALGVGATLQPTSTPFRARPWVRYGLADGRLNGGVSLVLASGARSLTFEVSRRTEDAADWPVIGPALNSFLAVLGGQDFGDYVLLDRARLIGSAGRGSGTVTLEVGWERSTDLATVTAPLSGVHRSNPPMAVGDLVVVRLGVGRSYGEPLTDGWSIRLRSEFGGGARDYIRFTGEGSAGVRLGPGRLGISLRGGTSWGDLPPYRAFTLGGRGTLVGEPFRAYGGTTMAWSRIAWQIPVPVAPFGSSTPLRDHWVVGPFLSAGWTTGDPGVSGRDGGGGIRPVVGVAADLLFQTLRIELGFAPRGGGTLGVVLDAHPAWWPIL